MTPTPQLGSPRPSRKSTEEGEKAAVAPPRESQLLNQSPLHTHFRVAQLVGCASLTTVLGWATFAVPSTLSPAGRLLPKGSDAAGAAGLGPLGPAAAPMLSATHQVTWVRTPTCGMPGLLLLLPNQTLSMQSRGRAHVSLLRRGMLRWMIKDHRVKQIFLISVRVVS